MKNKKLFISALAALTLVSGSAGAALAMPAKADEAPATVNPIALYEFKDVTNFGKDTMGNYDMKYRHLYVPGAAGPLLDKGTAVEGGGVEFSNEFCIAQDETSNMFKDVTAFTLAFEMKFTGAGDWQHLIGVGNHDSNYLAVVGTGNTANAAFWEYTTNKAYWDGAWFQNMSGWTNDGTTYQKVIITVQPGGELNLYLNGNKITQGTKLPLAIPEDYSLCAGSAWFSIGARFNGNADCVSTGGIKNVCFYDFAMDATAATAWNTNGKLTTADLSGVTTISSYTTVSFAESATDVVLNTSMTPADMLAHMNEGTVKANLSNSTTDTTELSVIWENVVKEGDNYYAIGNADTTLLGYANLAAPIKLKLEVASVKNVSDPVFTGDVLTAEAKDNMSDADILALVNSAKVTVTLSDETTQTVDVTFTKLIKNMGVYTAQGDVSLSGQVVGTAQVVIPVTVTNEGPMKELLPVAKYEFEDETNTGKDSMGNYDLGLVAREGGNKENAYGTGTIDNGKIYLNGDDIIACDTMNDVGDNIGNGFTLNFQYQQDGTWDTPAWACPVSFGFNDWSASVVCRFNVGNGSTGLRVGAQNVTKNDQDKYDTYWGPIVVADGTQKMYNITLSVRPGEKFEVYVDGVCAYTADCPATFTTKHDNMTFAVGGECVWTNGYCLFKGWVDNVSIYNFAMDLEQSNAFWEKGKVVVADMAGDIITSIDNTPAFETGKMFKTEGDKFTDKLTDTQALRKVNAATVNALFDEEGKSTTLPVTWQGLRNIENKWYLVGIVDTSNLGYATTLSGSTEIKYEVEVERVTRKVEISEDIENGTVTADKAEAYLGDVVTFTVTPAAGYQLKELTVDGAIIKADAEGKYTYTMAGNRNVEVSASFEEVGASNNGGATGSDNNAEKPAKKGCGSVVFEAIGTTMVLLVVAGGAKLLKKKD